MHSLDVDLHKETIRVRVASMCLALWIMYGIGLVGMFVSTYRNSNEMWLT